MTRKRLLVVLGPTAVGKTALSILLAKKFNTEIVSADSRQFFRELKIGTAKPSEKELLEVPHHFINSHSIETDFNVGKYEQEALEKIEALFKEKDQVILTGGSGLYINAVCDGMDALPPVQEAIREQLNNTYQTQGLAFLCAQLKDLDPQYHSEVDLNNPHRIVRALEVCLSTRQPYSSYRLKTKKERPFSVLKIGLTLPRPLLYQRIDERVDDMIASGLVEEAKSLFPKRHMNPLQTVGYTELFNFFEGHLSREAAISKIKQNTRNYAKRQLTWFNNDKEVHWFEPGDWDGMLALINR
jgi:tRNA dimethylallyltransferase